MGWPVSRIGRWRRAPAGWAPRAEYDTADGGYIVTGSAGGAKAEPQALDQAG